MPGGETLKTTTSERDASDPLRVCPKGCLFVARDNYCAWHGLPLRPLVGSIVQGYRLEHTLGRAGGFGVVYFARNRRNPDLESVVKVLKPPHCYRDEVLDIFVREAGLGKDLTCLQIPKIFDVVERPFPYIRMDYIRGRTFEDEFRRRGEAGEAPFDVDVGRGLLLGIARALAASHAKGLTHRDLKPANIMITDDRSGDPEEWVRVIDWGIGMHAGDGRPEEPEGREETLARIATPRYAAPEQFSGRNDERSDVYQFGLVAYEILTGRYAYTYSDSAERTKRFWEELHGTAPADDLARVRPDLPKDLVRVVSRCIEKDPEARYANGAELYEDLQPPDVLPRWARWALVASFVALAAVGVWATWFIDRDPGALDRFFGKWANGDQLEIDDFAYPDLGTEAEDATGSDGATLEKPRKIWVRSREAIADLHRLLETRALSDLRFERLVEGAWAPVDGPPVASVIPNGIELDFARIAEIVTTAGAPPFRFAISGVTDTSAGEAGRPFRQPFAIAIDPDRPAFRSAELALGDRRHAVTEGERARVACPEGRVPALRLEVAIDEERLVRGVVRVSIGGQVSDHPVAGGLVSLELFAPDRTIPVGRRHTVDVSIDAADLAEPGSPTRISFPLVLDPGAAIRVASRDVIRSGPSQAGFRVAADETRDLLVLSDPANVSLFVSDEAGPHREREVSEWRDGYEFAEGQILVDVGRLLEAASSATPRDRWVSLWTREPDVFGLPAEPTFIGSVRLPSPSQIIEVADLDLDIVLSSGDEIAPVPMGGAWVAQSRSRPKTLRLGREAASTGERLPVLDEDVRWTLGDETKTGWSFESPALLAGIPPVSQEVLLAVRTEWGVKEVEVPIRLHRADILPEPHFVLRLQERDVPLNGSMAPASPDYKLHVRWEPIHASLVRRVLRDGVPPAVETIGPADFPGGTGEKDFPLPDMREEGIYLIECTTNDRFANSRTLSSQVPQHGGSPRIKPAPGQGDTVVSSLPCRFVATVEDRSGIGWLEVTVDGEVVFQRDLTPASIEEATPTVDGFGRGGSVRWEPLQYSRGYYEAAVIDFGEMSLEAQHLRVVAADSRPRRPDDARTTEFGWSEAEWIVRCGTDTLPATVSLLGVDWVRGDGDYYVSRTEVSRRFFAEHGGTLPRGQPADDLPVTNVSPAEMQVFARRIGCALPRLEEWKALATRGHPWVLTESRGDAYESALAEAANHRGARAQPGLVPVGEAPGQARLEAEYPGIFGGAVHLLGNAEEVVERAKDEFGTIGGSYLLGIDVCRRASAFGFEPGFRKPSVGFRLVVYVTPSGDDPDRVANRALIQELDRRMKDSDEDPAQETTR